MTGWLSDNLVSILNGVALGCLLFALAVGLSLVFGVLDVLNLAHGSLFVAGAYAAWRLADDGSLAGFGLAVVLAAGIGGAGGLVLTVATRPLAGRSHLDQALLTLGIALVVTELVQSWFGRDPHGVLPPLAGSVEIGGGYPIYRLALIGAGVVLAFAVDRAVERTRVGALVRATVCDPDMVAAMGVNTLLVRSGRLHRGGCAGRRRRGARRTAARSQPAPRRPGAAARPGGGRHRRSRVGAGRAARGAADRAGPVAGGRPGAPPGAVPVVRGDGHRARGAARRADRHPERAAA